MAVDQVWIIHNAPADQIAKASSVDPAIGLTENDLDLPRDEMHGHRINQIIQHDRDDDENRDDDEHRNDEQDTDAMELEADQNAQVISAYVLVIHGS